MNCKNCNTNLDQLSIYCHNCGGKVIKNRLTLKNIAQHLGETFFNYDNTLIMTIICLIKAPEQVIDSYVKGVRKRYINPISFFGISLTLTGFTIFIIRKFYKNALDVSNLFDSTAMYSDKASQDLIASSSDFSLDYSSLIYASLIPLFAIISWILFNKKKYNFTEHLVIYMYSMSLYSIFSAILGLLILVINANYYLAFSTYFYIATLLYHCYLLKRLFNLTFKEIVLKTLLFIILFTIAFVVLTMGIGIIMAIVMQLNGELK
ncbi:DUF3667 domain-containing protein [Algibacter amylolyticus]|nr:DUF3667 domain-containing protein [Algibacter amylolyticus]